MPGFCQGGPLPPQSLYRSSWEPSCSLDHISHPCSTIRLSSMPLWRLGDRCRLCLPARTAHICSAAQNLSRSQLPCLSGSVERAGTNGPDHGPLYLLHTHLSVLQLNFPDQSRIWRHNLHWFSQHDAHTLTSKVTCWSPLLPLSPEL